MTDLLIYETSTSPRIVYDSSINEWSFSGRSYHEYPHSIYASLLKWVVEFEKKPSAKVTFKFNLEFINTHSLKVIFDVLMRVKRVYDPSKTDLKIEWYYESDDEDMKETGESIMTMSELPFDIISY